MQTLIDYAMHGTVVRPIGLDVPARCNAVSRNLRGLLTYARKSRVVCVITKRHQEPVSVDRVSPSGVLHVMYADGSIGRAHFNSHAIMIDWVRNRRTWRSAEMRHLDGSMGYLTEPGIIAGV